MRFRLEWLASYLSGEVPDAALLREKLTSAGFIVESVEGSGAAAILDVEVTPNRPDAMCHRGLAREAAVSLERAFQDAGAGPLAEGATPADQLATVTIAEPLLCSRYSARVIEGLAMRPSAGVEHQRLEALELAVISGPVDATNHVLWDIGQPLHAFDLDKLAKGDDGRAAIVVRRARQGEKLVTLDGVERELTNEHLVIADAEKAVALAGVMGGLPTAISETTTRVLLESAHFDPGAVRRTSRFLGMHTDASHRFERGCDPAATVQGLDRAARLIVRDCGGTVAKGVIDAVARTAEPRRLTLRFERVARFLGMEVPLERCLQILRALGLTCDEAGGLIRVTVPTARVDLVQEVDLIEEIIRHVGYDALPETLPATYVSPHLDPALAREERVRDILAGTGFFETSTYSFVSQKENAPFESVAPGAPMSLQNPLGEPFEVLRATPVLGLLKTATHNIRRGTADLALFEVGRAFGRDTSGPLETRRAGILLHGARTHHFSEPPGAADFYDGSGAVAAVFQGLGAEPPRFAAADLPFLAKGRAARILSAEGKDAGWVGVLVSTLGAEYDLGDAVVADVDLMAIEPLPIPTSIEAPSRFPGSDIDLTVTHRTSVPYRTLHDSVVRGGPPELLSVTATSRYQGEKVPEGFVKTTLHLRFGSPERSLSREEVNAWRDAAAARLLALTETRVDGYEGAPL